MPNKYIEEIKVNLISLDANGSAYSTQGRVQNILNNLEELIKDDIYKDMANKAFVTLELFHAQDIERNNMKYDDAKKPKASRSVKNESESFHSYVIDRINQIVAPLT